MAYTADVNRWRGPSDQHYERPHMLNTPWHPGWIAVTILGFIIWWPIGLALLFFTLGSRRMSCWSNQDRWQNKMERMQYKMDRMRGRMERHGFGFGFGPPSSGNRAFDEYRTETLAAARGGAGRVQELPRPSASRQGQGRVRPVHGATQDTPDPAADRPAARLISSLISGLTPLKAVRRMPPKS